MGNRFPRELRLKRKGDINDVFSRGRAVSCPGLRLVWKENDRPYNRLAISPTRRFRTAVSRNRVRRVLRETFRVHQRDIIPGHDIVLVAYPGGYSGRDRARQLSRLLKAAGLAAGPIVGPNADTQRSEL